MAIFLGLNVITEPIHEVLCLSFVGNFPRNILKVSVNEIYLKITYCKLQPHLRGDDELRVNTFGVDTRIGQEN